MNSSSSTTPDAGVESLVLPGSSWPLLAWRIIGNHDITAGWLLVKLALCDQVIEDILGLRILLQLLLHLHHLLLHILELLHLLSDAFFFDLGLLLLGSDLALGPSAFCAYL